MTIPKAGAASSALPPHFADLDLVEIATGLDSPATKGQQSKATQRQVTQAAAARTADRIIGLWRYGASTQQHVLASSLGIRGCMES